MAKLDEIVISFNKEELWQMIHEELQSFFELGFKAGLHYAKDEGWAYLPDELEQSVLAGNAWLSAMGKINGKS